MKIIIAALLYGFVFALLREFGIILGGIPTVLLLFFCGYISNSICANLDVKAFEKAAKKHGMTSREYMQYKFTRGFLDSCEANKHDRKALRSMLKDGVNNDVISKKDANALYYLFSKD